MSVERDESNLASPVPFEHVIFTDLDGLEGVLVDLNTKKYYQLNETASLIWRGLEKRLSVSHIARQLAENYDVTMDRAVSSIRSALGDFASHKLVTQAKP